MSYKLTLQLFICLFTQSLFSQFLENKVEGMLYGSIYGDALGGPIEFFGADDVNNNTTPIKVWQPNELINEEELSKLKGRLVLRPYTLRPIPEPYAMWTYNALPGTITDDSRNKIVLMHMLRTQLKSKALDPKKYATAYNTWLRKDVKARHSEYDSLNQLWLHEINFASNWVLGKRDESAMPPERMWNALPTCWGQMTNLPLSAIYTHDLTQSYLLAYSLSYFDTGIAKDLNASLIVGISKALTLDPAHKSDSILWSEIITAMTTIDPYNYNKVPWSERPLTKCLRKADSLVAMANGQPFLLFKNLNDHFKWQEKWEADLVVTLCFAMLKMCHFDPKATMQLLIEWGWDTDTYPQLMGAFFGAIYGKDFIPESTRKILNHRLQDDYLESIEEWTSILVQYNRAANKSKKSIFKQS